MRNFVQYIIHLRLYIRLSATTDEFECSKLTKAAPPLGFRVPKTERVSSDPGRDSQMVRYSVQLRDDLSTFLNSQLSAVKAYMIVPCLAPFHIRVELIVSSSALVLFFYPLLHGIFAIAILLD